MRIRYNSNRQGPGISIFKGDEADVSKEKGERLIASGHAEEVSPRKKPEVVKAVISKSSTKKVKGVKK